MLSCLSPPLPSFLVQLLVEKFLFPASVLMQVLMKDPGKECTHRHSPVPQVEVAVCVRVCWCQQSTPAGGSQPAVLCLVNVISPSFKTLSFTACDPSPSPSPPLPLPSAASLQM